ncbi:MAG TPA: universal stress protein [Candidatus Methylomirabilis sp.]|nr:universal stress protein [Candidatus Methylomirabilis sp.]
MNSPRPPDATIRRILVALDASISGLSALEAAVTLASRLEADLIGLFVEDADLLKLAALPFAREVGFPSASRRRLGSAEMERSLRAQASRAEAALIAAAERQSVRCSFRVVRGQVTERVLEAATEVDLLAVGRAQAQAWRAGSTAHVIVGAASRSVLLLSPGAPVRPPVAVVYDGSAESARALLLAQRVVQPESNTLTIMVIAADANNASRLRKQASGLLEGRGFTAVYITVLDADASGIGQTARRLGVGTLVLAADLRLKPAALEELLMRLDCAVILVR